MSAQYLPPQYRLRYGAPVPMARFQAYGEGKLDAWEIVLLYQDLLEAESVPDAMIDFCVHLITQGLVQSAEKVLQ